MRETKTKVVLRCTSLQEDVYYLHEDGLCINRIHYFHTLEELRVAVEKADSIHKYGCGFALIFSRSLGGE